MRILRVLLIASAALASAPAFAQAPQASPAALDLSQSQEALLRDYVEKVRPPPIGETVSVGAVLPMTIELHPLPTAVAVEVPAARAYRFVTGPAGIVVVDPADRKVVQILPLR